MRVCHLLNIFKKLAIGLLLGLIVSGCEPTMDGSVPVPNPPKAKQRFSVEQACVDSIATMRRDHGWSLQHARNNTMYRGVRALQDYSLKTCINCHVKADEAGNYPSIKDGTEHFCRSCHVYAAVSVDCFQCHANHPMDSSTKIANNINSLSFNNLSTQTVSQ